MGIKLRRASENLGCNLILLDVGRRVGKRMFAQIPKEFAERFSSAEAMTIGKPLYLLEALLPTGDERGRNSHLTGM